ncbi:hypothetical protein [Aurantimonas endophytica]|uniref:DUF4214 domain-containing protein n=1 Tax=Aurantimonas endophytica TaxID=1522175 RepID=A0A7W6MP72_9HYPH|nr:hypothetical protein [Aurantimonas endophytica]MBB4002645.1 hypothetical protein [Aurantimonas endophytica]MCO6403525.1 hypothetical protein [Aurantimonas endophytica]
MALTTQDVIGYYSLILGEKPEPMEVAYYLETFEDVPSLRQQLEFIANCRAGAISAGTHPAAAAQ